jgi:hypothetical protein
MKIKSAALEQSISSPDGQSATTIVHEKAGKFARTLQFRLAIVKARSR